jgi:hypothetical protein
MAHAFQQPFAYVPFAQHVGLHRSSLQTILQAKRSSLASASASGAGAGEDARAFVAFVETIEPAVAFARAREPTAVSALA